MKIGIIGMGMVGEAVAFGLKRIGHEITGYDIDPKKGCCDWWAVQRTELIFICVPTPCINNECNTEDVWRTVASLNTSGYEGLVVIKSTVTPGTTKQLQETFPGMKIAFCPEFLRERARFYDFYENMEVCIVGVSNKTHALLLMEAHGSIPRNFVEMSPTEAELAKYFVNCFNAYRINFANAFFDVCKHLGADYQRIKSAVSWRNDTRSSYLDCGDQFRAFGGACLPKDTQAFTSFVSQLGLATKLFADIVVENDRVKCGVTTAEEEQRWFDRKRSA